MRVERGHLLVEDGIGARRRVRLARVRHGLRRLVVIGADGIVSLAALRWLADQDAAFVMLDRDGSVLATTGPVRPSDARLRRAQSLAHQSDIAVRIARELITQKIAGQEQLVRDKLRDFSTADAIAKCRDAVKSANTIPLIRQFEAQAAQAYWSAWRPVPVAYPEREAHRVPEHWKVFGTRKSPLTESPRLAVNPANAMLNYLYAVLESESRLGLAALGLDPGIGVLHVDTPSRDSLACDLMEAVRPKVDSYLFDWISREPLRREWFFEQPDGNCRLMGSFAVRLSQTASMWGSSVGPVAEWVSRTLWSTLRKSSQQIYPATRLTQSRRRKSKDDVSTVPANRGPKAPRICRACGQSLKRGKGYCRPCSIAVSRENLVEAARLGRVLTHSPKAEALRAATQRRHAAALKTWYLTNDQNPFTEEIYRNRILPRLLNITVPAIVAALGVSEPYATDIRSGRRVPHPRHWQRIAGLVDDVESVPELGSTKAGSRTFEPRL